MAMSRVAGDEDPPLSISIRYCDAQVPETDVVELTLELESRCFLDKTMEIEILSRGVFVHRGVEEKAFAHVHSAKELPISLQVGMHYAIGGALREALEPLMQLPRAENGEHHAGIVISSIPANAKRLAHSRMRAVSADDVVGFQHLLLT